MNFVQTLSTAIQHPELVFRRIQRFRQESSLRSLGRKPLASQRLEFSDVTHSARDSRNQSAVTFFFDDSFPWTTLDTELLRSADAVLRHEFNLLGSGATSLGPKINWHKDVKTGYVWPLIPSSVIPYDLTIGADIKAPWELSRMQHLPTLGIAFRMTGDKKYFDEIIAQFRDWHATNPVLLGVNWKCTMDVALRLVNLIFTWYLIRPDMDDGMAHEFLASVQLHAKFIRSHLEYNPKLTTNHYLSDLLGLGLAGLLFPEFRDAHDWLVFAQQELEKEMQKQVYEDGISFEHSTSYHRLALEIFSSWYLLGQYNGLEFSGSYIERLKRMFTATSAMMKPNGRMPQIGDVDNGRVFILDKYGSMDQRDHRGLIAIGQRLFPDEPAISGGLVTIDTLLLAARLPESAISDVPRKSRAFPHGGFFVLRSKKYLATVKASGLGQNGYGGHDHNDLTSFELNFNGVDFIIDPGTYAYTNDPSLRNAFRSSVSHSIATIDGAELFPFTKTDLFSLTERTHVLRRAWSEKQDIDTLLIEHDGFTSLTPPVTFSRTFALNRTDETFELLDTFLGRGPHSLLWTFVLDPEVRISRESAGIVLLHHASGLVLRLQFDERLSCVETVWMTSPEYGRKEPTKKLLLTGKLLADEASAKYQFRFSDVST